MEKNPRNGVVGNEFHFLANALVRQAEIHVVGISCL